MRHNKKFNHLGRTASHRAMLSNMASSLIKHKRITTTVAKAKALKKYVEPLLTKSKEDTTNSRRVVFSNLQDKVAVTELFKEISVRLLTVRVVTLVSSRLAIVWVIMLHRCASLNSSTTMRTWTEAPVEEAPVAEEVEEAKATVEETPATEAPAEEAKVEEAPKAE
jgi:large subunit ribosomal protein L17